MTDCWQNRWRNARCLGAAGKEDRSRQTFHPGCGPMPSLWPSCPDPLQDVLPVYFDKLAGMAQSLWVCLKGVSSIAEPSRLMPSRIAGTAVSSPPPGRSAWLSLLRGICWSGIHHPTTRIAGEGPSRSLKSGQASQDPFLSNTRDHRGALASVRCRPTSWRPLGLRTGFH